MVACSNISHKSENKCRKCVKVHKMTVDLPPLHISLPKKGGKFEQETIKSQTSVNISQPGTGSLPQDIGLQLHTNVSVESKCSRYNVKSFLILVLFLEVGFLHLYSHRISSELRTAEKMLSDINLRLNCLTTSNRNLRESVQVIQNSCEKLLKGRNHFRRHPVYKRDVSSQGKYDVEGHIENRSHLYQNKPTEHANVTEIQIGSTRHERAIPGRGKSSQCKMRKGSRHNHGRYDRMSGPLLAHFKGALPEAVIQDGGIIAPWYIDNSAAKEHSLSNILLQEGRGKVEIIEKGLYFIYAQVYYLTTETLNSFSIHVETEGERDELVLATCSTVAASVNLSEVSCYTAVVRFLMPGDKVYILQRERNRRIVFRNGQTFFGVTMLNPGKTPTQ